LNYGADRIRYLSPSRPAHGSVGRTSIAEVEDVPPDGLRVNYHMVIEIEGGQRPPGVCRADRAALPLNVMLEKAGSRSMDHRMNKHTWYVTFEIPVEGTALRGRRSRSTQTFETEMEAKNFARAKFDEDWS